ncbi:MAG: M81 family metallopeptidase [Ilumatobacteraceae bacterium]
MVLPQIAQLTAADEPLGMVVAAGQAGCRAPIRNVSVFGGFSLGDVPDAGVSVCVTADAGHGDEAAALAAQLAGLAWRLRDRYRVAATPVDAAVQRARRAAAGEEPSVILADTADNPGGGAPGNTTFLLAALHGAGVDGVVMGLQCDPVWSLPPGRPVRAPAPMWSSMPAAPRHWPRRSPPRPRSCAWWTM